MLLRALCPTTFALDAASVRVADVVLVADVVDDLVGNHHHRNAHLADDFRIHRLLVDDYHSHRHLVDDCHSHRLLADGLPVACYHIRLVLADDPLADDHLADGHLADDLHTRLVQVDDLDGTHRLVDDRLVDDCYTHHLADEAPVGDRYTRRLEDVLLGDDRCIHLDVAEVYHDHLADDLHGNETSSVDGRREVVQSLAQNRRTSIDCRRLLHHLAKKVVKVVFPWASHHRSVWYS